MMNRMHDVLGHFDPQRTVWVEDESRRIGTVWLPDEFYRRMQTAPVHILDVPLEERVANLERDYGGFSHDELIGAFERVRTKLGGERTTAAIEAVRAHDLATAIRLALQYYDRTYDHCMSKRSTGERP
jgi:tRNA 2-selenouridine synthase